MDKEEFKRLAPGDIVRSCRGGSGYTVTDNYGTRVTAVRVADLTNPDEWSLVSKAAKRERPQMPLQGVVIHLGNSQRIVVGGVGTTKEVVYNSGLLEAHLGTGNFLCVVPSDPQSAILVDASEERFTR